MSIRERQHHAGPAATGRRRTARGTDAAVIAGGVLMVLCCAVGPAAIGAAAGNLLGGWVGIACAVGVAAILGSVVHRRARRRGRGC